MRKTFKYRAEGNKEIAIENEVHFCACGCGGIITFKPDYRRKGFAKYLVGHRNRGRTKENDLGIAAMATKMRGRTKETHTGVAAQANKLRGRTAATHLGVAAQAEQIRGRTKENNSGVAAMAETLRGRTAETHPHIVAAAAKMRGRTKYNDASVASMATKKCGRTKDNDSGVAAMAAKKRGRTKENDVGLAAMAEKRRGQTKENNASVAAQAAKMRGRRKETHSGVAATAAKAQLRTGDKNHQWLGGISFEPYTPAFNNRRKEFIRERDGYRCQKCGVPECECRRKLDCHHIDFVKENCDPMNLISLCRSCNAKVNKNRSQWIKYFQRKMRQRKLIHFVKILVNGKD